MSGFRRIIVGTSGSPGCLPALRCAEGLARVCDALVIPVLAWTPPGGDTADRLSPCGYLRRVWAEDARQRLSAALSAAWGDVPADLSVRPVVKRGDAGPVLVGIACDHGDLLMIGAGRRGAITRVVSGRVSRYCLAHAHCPVIAVPPSDLGHAPGHALLRWASWHRTLTPDQLLHDRGGTRA